MGERFGNSVIDVGGICETDTADAYCLGHGREVRIIETGPKIEEARGLLLELDEAERTVVEHDDLHGQPELRETDEISHQHGEPAVARQRDYLSIRERTLGADRLCHGIGHRAVPEGADEPALSVHGEIPR